MEQQIKLVADIKLKIRKQARKPRRRKTFGEICEESIFKKQTRNPCVQPDEYEFSPKPSPSLHDHFHVKTFINTHVPTIKQKRFDDWRKMGVSF
jgi:hypothetical protein